MKIKDHDKKNTGMSLNVSPELLDKLRKNEAVIEREKKEDEKRKEDFWGQSTLSDSYFRVAGSLLGIILFLYFTALVFSPIFLLIEKIYPPATTRYVIFPIFIVVGYGVWRFVKWAN